ncbi:DUF6708 domain-containing protein [Alkalilimnicola ehrlichii MLHE-1]|uniref:DUF6708 domain-containing protein n=1 Tax=Alkalilimnicola ehrlichii (strain ATCC BAA-1101 / DSM 17681 / MLHE-1) TaxID=187272 RepID=Q0ACP1_ALKEH|nr:DUF6708 domain-containing protein [Alkalilimnicola ehrlichii]ABI55396.1 hypothetical protein Mlg_0038 [Alkalilimnicola ehrlichii MLHE-1]
MHHLRRFFADLSRNIGLADEVITLRPDRRAAAQPMQAGDVQDQTEHYLDITTGSSRGLWTGFWGWGTLMGLVVMSPNFFHGGERAVFALQVNGAMAGVTLVFFLLEVFWPAALPLRFNRRTREVYFQDGKKLYHTPWDEAVAWLQETRQVTHHAGVNRLTPLQILLQRFQQPDEVIAVNLNLPMGHTAQTQAMLWEYLRCYMENGPWFDEQGRNTPESTRQAVRKRFAQRNRTGKIDIELHRELVDMGIMTRDRMWFTNAFQAVMLPALVLRDFVWQLAQRRAARSQWHPLVRERCRADGPTSRLYDIERDQGLHPDAPQTLDPHTQRRSSPHEPSKA